MTARPACPCRPSDRPRVRPTGTAGSCSSSGGAAGPVRTAGGRIDALKVRHDPGPAGPKYTMPQQPGRPVGSPPHVRSGSPPMHDSAPDRRRTQGRCRDVIERHPDGLRPGITSWLSRCRRSSRSARSTCCWRWTAMETGHTRCHRASSVRPCPRGFDVTLETWDAKLGKGIDDLFAGGGRRSRTRPGRRRPSPRRDQRAGVASPTNPTPNPPRTRSR